MPTYSFQCIGILWILEQFKTPVDFVPPLKVSIKMMKFTFDLFLHRPKKKVKKGQMACYFHLSKEEIC